MALRRSRGVRARVSPSARQAPPRALALAPVIAGAMFLAGCGGGSRQDANETAASYRVEILHAGFPLVQAVARPARLAMLVRNSGTQTIPNVTVTIDSFDYHSSYPGLSAAKRPIWVIERGPGAIAFPPVESQEVSTPGGGQTAYVNTWALGSLPAGRTKAFVWQVVPVKSGLFTVHYFVAAGLSGKATASLAGGGPAHGQLKVLIRPAPPNTHVDPRTGQVVPGKFTTYPPTP